MDGRTGGPGLQHLILEILTEEGGLYGQEMVRRSGGLLGVHTVYVHLRRLRDKGLVESCVGAPPAGSRGPQRRRYWLDGWMGRRMGAELLGQRLLAALADGPMGASYLAGRLGLDFETILQRKRVSNALQRLRSKGLVSLTCCRKWEVVR